MSTVQNYHDALLALSGNPALAAARSGLLVGMSGEELIDVITCGLKTGISRDGLNIIAAQLFDEIAAAQAGGVVAPVEDNNSGDVADDSDDVVRNKGRNLRRRAKRGGKASPDPKTKSNPIINYEREEKRKQSCASRKEDKNHEEAEADIVVGDEPEGDANAAADTNADTDATTDEAVPIPWKEIQEYSVMFDLSRIDSEDGCSSDEDYTEEFADTELWSGGRFRTTTESSLMRNIDVVFRVPIGEGFEFKELDEFPITFVKEMTRKFNKDYLRKPKHRTQYRKMMNEVDDADTCVYRLLNAPYPPKPKVDTPVQPEPKPKPLWELDGHELLERMYNEERELSEEEKQRIQQEQKQSQKESKERACSACYHHRKLCARFMKSDEGEPRLVIYPFGPAEINGGDWRGMRFWVRQPERERC
ncbi:uncharacterized protein J4E87_004609 [Alternaria ethzedia]|uniref:uncharacterized protein n=1 Tax=Alternaria ethzedia TaxID=181014 RepID=UPI0020C23F9D|nr:uncharacterized protein J4E87_004609 [Alternaria ethzedia]KAI4626109.1 hypothetical protein J4E87_004609 [Alternaria ethzedia]